MNKEPSLEREARPVEWGGIFTKRVVSKIMSGLCCRAYMERKGLLLQEVKEIGYYS